MEKLFDTISKYVERLLSPYQFWLALMFLSAILFGLSDAQNNTLGLTNFVSENRGYISLILIASGLVLIIKLIMFLFNRVQNWKPVDAKNLDIEEKAILMFYRRNRFENFSADRDHPAIKSLVKRGFLSKVLSFIIVSGNNFESFEITKPGRKKLQSQKVTTEISSSFDSDQKVLDFINTISKETYHTRNLHRFD